MNYLSARRAEKAFIDFRRLCNEYWASNETSTEVRQQINHLLPALIEYARELKLSIHLLQGPPPAFSAPTLRLNVLRAVLEQEHGYAVIGRQQILDFVDQCIGATRQARRKGFWHLVFPLWWIIDIPAFAIGVPFKILRAVGFSDEVEETLIAHVAKLVMTVLLALVVIGLALRFGWAKYISEILKLFGR